MVIHQISVFVENRHGRLAEITGILAENQIDIRALSIADTSDFGILRLIVNDPDKAMAALRAASVTVSKTEVIAVELNDSPGALHNILTLLSDNGISVEYVYAFITRKNQDAYVILRVENNDNAIKVLQANNHSLLPSEDVYSL